MADEKDTDCHDRAASVMVLEIIQNHALDVPVDYVYDKIEAVINKPEAYSQCLRCSYPHRWGDSFCTECGKKLDMERRTKP